jgi:hypothetical protein
MDDDKFRRELLMRKFEPVTDWKPAGAPADITDVLKRVFNETLEDAQKRREALEKALGPLSEDAWARIRELGGFLEDATAKSSKEARSLLAKTLQAMADRIKP